MWLSHHWPEDYDRCVLVGRRHVCRRCLFFYPVCFAVMVASLAGVGWPRELDAWLVWLLPVPVVVEWWGEHLGWWRYAPTRQVALSLLAAPAVGRGLARYLEEPGDPLFWTVVVTYAVVCAVPFFVAMARRSSGPGDAAELEGIDEERMAGYHAHGQPPPARDLET
jgi:hypothetical protein